MDVHNVDSRSSFLRTDAALSLFQRFRMLVPSLSWQTDRSFIIYK
jgi:hypothetical protein